MSRDFRDLLAAFNEQDVEYLLVGAHAFAYHCKPRATKDLDIWIEANPENAAKVVHALTRFGAPPSHYDVSVFESPGAILQLGVAPIRIGILTDLPGLVFSRAKARAVESEFLGQQVFILGLEDLIQAKRAAGRPQDLLDCDELEELRKK